MSKIEQIISEIEEYIDNCKLQPLSSTKIIVNRNELEELIDELKENIPDEIKKYQRIIANRDAILKDAQDKAEEMLKKANEMTAQLVSEHEIMAKAYEEANGVIEDANNQAQDIVDKATADANALKSATNQYLDDALANIQNILNSSIEGLNVQYDGIIRSLESNLEITTQNRKAYQDSQREIEEYEAQHGRSDLYEAEPTPEISYDEEGNLSGDVSIEDALNQTEFYMDASDEGELDLI